MSRFTALPLVLSALVLGACGALPVASMEGGKAGASRTLDEKADARRDLKNAKFATAVITGGPTRLLQALQAKQLANARKHAQYLLTVVTSIDAESRDFDAKLTADVCKDGMQWSCRNLVYSKKEIFAVGLELQQDPAKVDFQAAIALARRIQSNGFLERVGG